MSMSAAWLVAWTAAAAGTALFWPCWTAAPATVDSNSGTMIPTLLMLDNIRHESLSAAEQRVLVGKARSPGNVPVKEK